MFKQVFLDMDGILCDFDQGVRDFFNVEWYPTEWEIPYQEMFGLSCDEFWQILNQPEFWVNLPWTEDGKRIVSIVEPMRPCILSACRMPYAFPGKIEWLYKNYPGPVEEGRWLFSTHDSKQYCSRPGAILIDDREENCRQWERAGGTAILYPRPWNSLRGNPYPLEYLMSHLMQSMGGN